MIFLDTSAIYALADRDDDYHDEAVRLFHYAQESGRPVVTHNYVLVEAATLLHRRLGRDTAMAFLKEAVRFRMHWVSSELHAEAVAYLGTHGTSKLSLVDAVSFLVMKQMGLQEYLGFDQHFADEGFRAIAAG